MAVAGQQHQDANGSAEVGAGVRQYYGQELQSSKDLKTSACTAASRPSHLVAKILQQVPAEVSDKFYGCGAPLPQGIEGLRVLDLGSGSGRDAYVCAALVGQHGSVTGVDFTKEQLEVARRHVGPFCSSLGYAEPNMRFVQGDIQDLQAAGIADASADLIISNCVINLVADKSRVLREAWRVLADGGELHFSDVYCDRRLPEHVRRHRVLWGECIAGAMYVEDFRRAAHAAGFVDVRVLSSSPVSVQDAELLDVVGNANFTSITFRLFKLPGLLESLCEDYGQTVRYLGTIPGQRHSFQLDGGHRFQAGKPELACGSTAAMLGEDGRSWLAKHFEVRGDRSIHYGLFASCSPALSAAEAAPSSSCCS